jgi:uncharacterized membrane protein YeaQ/YmgE (transglycosylase-associated protein family)
VYATIIFEPQGIVSWVIIGLIAGALAGRVVRGRGYGCCLDIVIGIAGSVIGGALLGYFVSGQAGFLETLVVAFIGSVLLLAILRAISGARA